MRFLILILLSLNLKAFDPLKNEIEGCPENSICSKATGAQRIIWLNFLKSLNSPKINENKAGFPIHIWSKENELKNESGLITWDSPCKQHQVPGNKYYIGELFVNNLSKKTIEKYPSVVFPQSVLKIGNVIKPVVIQRGDAPLMITNNSFYYTKDDEGHFYGMLLSFNGDLKVIKTKSITKFPKEIDCPKEMTEEFYRKAPSLNFYKGHFCKEIWNQDTNDYSTLVLGWSCN